MILAPREQLKCQHPQCHRGVQHLNDVWHFRIDGSWCAADAFAFQAHREEPAFRFAVVPGATFAVDGRVGRDCADYTWTAPRRRREEGEKP
jgi:hypothetical protein